VTSPAFFDSAAQFRAWLERNHQQATELRVGFRKVSTGLPSMTWSESVEEALCFGWIDGVRKRIDDSSYMIRFTPRRRESTWSAVNLAKMKILIAEGRVSPAGLAVYEGRKAKKKAVYSFEQERPVELAASEARQFKRNNVAWKFFESVAPSYWKVVTHWVVSAKKPETRARRLEELIGACAEGRRLLK